MKHTWIKPYLEILDDDKLAELPGAVCWHFVQFLLVAAEIGKRASSCSLNPLTRHLTPDTWPMGPDPLAPPPHSFLVCWIMRRTRQIVRSWVL